MPACAFPPNSCVFWNARLVNIAPTPALIAALICLGTALIKCLDQLLARHDTTTNLVPTSRPRDIPSTDPDTTNIFIPHAQASAVGNS